MFYVLSNTEENSCTWAQQFIQHNIFYTMKGFHIQMSAALSPAASPAIPAVKVGIHSQVNWGKGGQSSFASPPLPPPTHTRKKHTDDETTEAAMCQTSELTIASC